MSCQYDPQGRLTQVSDSLEGVFNYQYQDGEADIRKQKDNRTASSLINERSASTTQRTVSGAHYTRPGGTPWEVLAWHPGLAVFDVPAQMGITQPDVTQQAADHPNPRMSKAWRQLKVDISSRTGINGPNVSQFWGILPD